MTTVLHWLSGLVTLVLVAFGAQLSTVPPPDPLVAAREMARNADLRGDWEGLQAAVRRLKTLARSEDAALRHYYLGYTSWRMASLAYLAGGAPLTTPLLEDALAELDAAVTVDPRLADANALIGVICGTLIAADPSRAVTLGPRGREAAGRAFASAPGNPRVLLMRAMATTFSPPAVGGDRTRGLGLWREALTRFETSTATDPRLPDWGEAEGWGWLGGAHLMAGEHAEALRAFDRALALRPDFWWVERIARPQALAPSGPG
jgi:tetratricopeptide (TPR) repeat protein